MEKKPLAAIILGSKKAKSEDEEADDEIFEELGQALLKAIDKRDAEKIAKAVKEIADY